VASGSCRPNAASSFATRQSCARVVEKALFLGLDLRLLSRPDAIAGCAEGEVEYLPAGPVLLRNLVRGQHSPHDGVEEAARFSILSQESAPQELHLFRVQQPLENFDFVVC
jgi:hypothetical protein